MLKQRLLRMLSTKFILAVLSMALLSYFTVTLSWEANSWLTGMSIILATYFGVNQYQKRLIVK